MNILGNFDCNNGDFCKIKTHLVIVIHVQLCTQIKQVTVHNTEIYSYICVHVCV